MPVDVPLVFGLLAFVFYQVSNLTSKQYKEIYAKNRSFIPSWLFGPVWSVLYVLIFFSTYYAFANGNAANQYPVALLTVLVINLFLNKYWTRAFFDDESPRLAMAIIVGINGTGIAALVLMGLSSLWLEFGLFVAYPIWVAVATILNCQWVCMWGSTADSIDEILPTQMKPPPRIPRKRVMAPPPKMPLLKRV